MSWKDCKNILVIRADNLGDLLMSTPAIRALKESFNAKITVLTSTMAAGIAGAIPEISRIISYDLPWVKTGQEFDPQQFYRIIETLKDSQFDAAVIFSVYSQNPLPAAMLAYLAKIPRRLAYCRENPYQLLTDWIPDKEPYSLVRHQVRRDLDLVASVGAITNNEHLSLSIDSENETIVTNKLLDLGIDPNMPWLILHPGVSEEKRRYPFKYWIETGKKIIQSLGYQVLLTGTASEKALTENIQAAIGTGAFSAAGAFNLPEFMTLIHLAPLVISVNTGTIHIAAATGTPVIVLYAMTNPQHSPWKSRGKVLPFDVPEDLRSKNEVIRHVHEKLFMRDMKMALPEEIVSVTKDFLANGNQDMIPELIPLRSGN